jgi:hypothetical protein
MCLSLCYHPFLSKFNPPSAARQDRAGQWGLLEARRKRRAPKRLFSPVSFPSFPQPGRMNARVKQNRS